MVDKKSLLRQDLLRNFFTQRCADLTRYGQAVGGTVWLDVQATLEFRIRPQGFPCPTPLRPLWELTRIWRLIFFRVTWLAMEPLAHDALMIRHSRGEAGTSEKELYQKKSNLLAPKSAGILVLLKFI